MEGNFRRAVGCSFLTEGTLQPSSLLVFQCRPSLEGCGILPCSEIFSVQPRLATSLQLV